MGFLINSSPDLQTAIKAIENYAHIRMNFLKLTVMSTDSLIDIIGEFTLELSDVSAILLYIAGIIFTLGRLMHGIAFSFMRKNVFLRIGGMSLTFIGFFILIIPALEIVIS